MTRSFRSMRLPAALIIGAMALPPPADAGIEIIKSMDFDAKNAVEAIHVISTGKQRWNALKSGLLRFSGRMNIDMRGLGNVFNVGVVLGACSTQNPTTCRNLPVLFDRHLGRGHHGFSSRQDFAIPTSGLPVSGPGGIAITPFADQAIAACNDHLQADGPTKSHQFAMAMSATFIADTATALEFDPGGGGNGTIGEVDATRTDDFTVPIICDAVVKPAANDISADLGEFRPEKVELHLATYRNQTEPNAATICDGLKVTARVETSRAGPVDLRLWRSAGGAITNEFRSAWASWNAQKNGYFADFVRDETVLGTTNLQFMAEVVGDAFAPSSPWKAITVHCTGAGGGGLADSSGDDNRDPIPPAEPDPQVNVPTGGDGFANENPQRPDAPAATWTAQLAIADSAGNRKTCPRKAQVFAEATRNEPGDFAYRISCNNGASFGGEAQSFNQGGPSWEAYATHDFSVNRTRTVACTLQEVLPGGSRRTIASDSFDFTCNNPAVDPDADAIVGSLPEPKPAKPSVSIPCAPGFRLVDEACERIPVVVAPCAGDQTRVAGKCVDKPSVSILCAPGFTLVGKTCVMKPAIATACKANEKLVRGNCVARPGVSILCKPGFKLVGKTCVKKPVIATACTANQKLVRGKCVAKPVVSIFCLDGLVPKNGKCVKPAKPLRLGAKAMRGANVR